MAIDFTIRVVAPSGAVRVITRDDIAASIEAAGYVASVGLQQLEFVIDRALNPPPRQPILPPHPTDKSEGALPAPVAATPNTHPEDVA